MSKGSQRDAMCVIDNSVIAKNKKGIQIIWLKLHVWKQDVFVRVCVCSNDSGSNSNHIDSLYDTN